MQRKCRAWVTTGPQKLEMQEFDIPQVADDSALLKVEACGICATDKHRFLGGQPQPPYPFIMGHEFIGTVVQMGRHVNQKMAVVGGALNVGDRVSIGPRPLACGHCNSCLHMPGHPSYCTSPGIRYGFTSVGRAPGVWGGFSEYVYLHPRTYVFKLPENMPLNRAVLVEPLASSIRAIERAHNPWESFVSHGYGIGSNAMVIGIGPIGALIVAALRHSGANEIIAQARTAEKMMIAKTMGANTLVNGRLPFDDRLKQVRDATEGTGADVVFEAAGNPDAFKEALEFVRRGGKVVEVGSATETGQIDVHPYTICFKDLDIHGSWSYPPIIFKDAISLLNRTNVPVEQVVTHSLPFEKLPEALDLSGSIGTSKVIITM